MCQDSDTIPCRCNVKVTRIICKGVFIFILLVVLNKKVRSTVIQWLRSNVHRLRRISAGNSSSVATTVHSARQEIRSSSSPQSLDILEPSVEDRDCSNSCARESQLDNSAESCLVSAFICWGARRRQQQGGGF
ncbi:unnamed protein product [Cylicocyclus nassatus]|uniref:Uncharacterized protein n=1 Tax=Cylicocyclus nassatus TaxID=53992 RepID=A0AA36MGB2_CYLNA|nr:unnamed protein product [Cylicocyclus nassatus]